MQRFGLIGGMLAFALVFNGSALAEPKLVIGTFELPPYTYAAEGGEIKGSSIRKLERIAKVQDLDIEIKLFPWSRALQMAEDGALDAILPCAPRPERADRFLFSQMMGGDNVVLITPNVSEEGDITEIRDLNAIGDRLAVLADGAIESLLNANGVTGYERVFQNQSILLMVTNRHIDFGLGFEQNILSDMEAHGIAAKNITMTTLAKVNYGLCVSRKAPDASAKLDLLNTGISEIRD